MCNTKTNLRRYFNERLAKLSEIEDSETKYQRESDLLLDADETEFAYRSGLIRGKIIGLGLEKHTSEIIDGMNRTVLRVNPSDITEHDSAERYLHFSRIYSDACLRFGLNYVDRWVMYNYLFNGKV